MISAVRDLARFLLPNCCVCCERLIPVTLPDDLVCTLCVSRMRPVLTGCVRCAQPLPPVGPCRFCAGWSPALVSARSAVWLDSEARQLAHHFKYEDLPALSEAIATIVVRHVQCPVGTIMPVPLSSRRLRTRGYNQAARIAEALAARWSLPYAGVLTRIRDTPTQTTLTPEARLSNVAGAFAAAPPGTSRPDAVLVDDILTTGATLSAAAAALQRAGWKTVSAVTFARALPQEMRMLSVRDRTNLKAN